MNRGGTCSTPDLQLSELSIKPRTLKLDAEINCVHRQWFMKVFFSPCIDFHYRNVSVFNAALPEGPKTMAIQYWFLALSFVYRHFTRFSGETNGRFATS